MATKPIYSEAASDSQLKAAAINSNFEKLATAIENCLGRGGISESPNSMSGTLDMNTNRIQNLGDPVNTGDAVTLNYINQLSSQNVEFGFITVAREYTATLNQTVFSMDINYTQSFNNIAIFKNGLRLRPSEYVETSTNSFTLNVACAADDKVLVLVNQPVSTTDPLTLPAGQSLYTAVQNAIAAANSASNSASQAAASAATVPTFPSMSGQGANIPRVNVGGSAIEYRTPAQTVSDLSLSTAAKTDSVTAYTRSHYPTPVAISSSGGALAVDCNLHTLATSTLTENTTVGAATNQSAGKVVELIITGASTYTLSWNVNWKMADNSTVSTTPVAGKMTRIIAESDGTYMYIYRIIQGA